MCLLSIHSLGMRPMFRLRFPNRVSTVLGTTITNAKLPRLCIAVCSFSGVTPSESFDSVLQGMFSFATSRPYPLNILAECGCGRRLCARHHSQSLFPCIQSRQPFYRRDLYKHTQLYIIRRFIRKCFGRPGTYAEATTKSTQTYVFKQCIVA